MPLTAAQIEERLERIEADLADRQGRFEEAAAEKHRMAREYELRHAIAFLAATGATATERKARAIEALAAAADGIYTRNMEAEGEYEGLKAAMRALEIRATVGMSLLKVHAREVSRVPDSQPSWSGRAA
jgi:hypothetical protein